MRLRVLLTVLLVAFLLAPLVAAEDPPYETLPTDVAEDILRAGGLARVTMVRAPLMIAPAFAPPGGSFPLEIALASSPLTKEAWLVSPVATCNVAVGEPTQGPSRLWADRSDLVVRHAMATVTNSCPPGLYDLHVRVTMPGVFGLFTTSREDRQVHAVRVMDPQRHAALASGEAHPRFVVMADPQIGDPRAFQDGITQSLAAASAAPFASRADGVLGDAGSDRDGRWKAVRHALEEAAEEDPDFILIAGDLGFGQLVPGSYAVEYEEIWRVLATSRVPLFVAPGNHDGYVANGQDGFAYWRAYLGPTYFMAQATPGTHVLVMNTYDWSELDRAGASYAVSSWGGQVRETQMAWIDATLAQTRAAHPDGRIVSVSHHSPSWKQDHWHDEDPTGATRASEGVPVAEQVTRGAVSYATTDQSWSGTHRLELRDTLRAHGVEVAFAGHTHHDRIARDDGEGRIVDTHESFHGVPEDYDPRALHYVDRDGTHLAGWTQAQLADLVRTAPGPLYVDTTTLLSGTNQYWGYRVVHMGYDEHGHLILPGLGYAITQPELDAFAAQPTLFNVAHASLGLFSKPLHLSMGEPWNALDPHE